VSGSGEPPFDWVAASGRKAKGRRPEYFDDPALDRLYSTVFALAAEVSALRERQDTVERLLDEKGTLSRADIEAYEPDRAAADERGLATRAYIARIMRGFQQEVEAMEASDPPIMDIVEKLSRE
jgi:predicted  nucleic acid-binding Zn-ribbon protein